MATKSGAISIGGRIRELRENLDMSQEELAKKLGYKSRSSINKIELDQRNLTQSKIKAIADALETTPGFIMGWELDDASRIKEAREKSGLSQKALAKKIGVSVDVLDAWERGTQKPRKNDFDAIAEMLEMDPFSLYDWDTANDVLGRDINQMITLHGADVFPLLENFDRLNDLGKATAVKMVETLADTPEFRAADTD